MKDASRDDDRGKHDPYHIDAPISAWLSASRAQTDTPPNIRIDARAIADARMGVVEHATLVLERDSGGVVVRYAGASSDLPQRFRDPRTPVFTLHQQLVIPALINAHTHLDLTHIGPCPHEPGDGFVSWVDMIRANRASDDAEIDACVRQGIKKSLAGGVIAVGDIAGAPHGRLTDAPAHALAKSPLIGVSYLEFFGIGSSATHTLRRISDYLNERAHDTQGRANAGGIMLGFQPHATNTVDLSVYRWVTKAAAERGMPLCTHLAETPEERRFIAEGTGPQREMLERFGVWDDSVIEHIGKGLHPIQHLRPVLEMSRYLVAHVNDADDDGIRTLAETGTSVAYCPRASLYFDAEQHFGPHRYRDMLQAGVNVCLGTDSIVNIDTPDRISTLDDMRLLHALGEQDPARLLTMGTVNPARALGLDPNRFTLGAGCKPIGILSIDLDSAPNGNGPWEAAMRAKCPPDWLYLE